MSAHERTISRYSQASNRSTSRSVGRSRQARISASWVASSASSVSRRTRRAIAYNRSTAPAARTPKASRSPPRALSTSSACTLRSFRGRPIWSPTRYGGGRAATVHNRARASGDAGPAWRRSHRPGGGAPIRAWNMHMFRLTSERPKLATWPPVGTWGVPNGESVYFREAAGPLGTGATRPARPLAGTVGPEMRVAAGWTDPRPLTVLSRARFQQSFFRMRNSCEGCQPRGCATWADAQPMGDLPADAQQSTAREHAVGHEDLHHHDRPRCRPAVTACPSPAHADCRGAGPRVGPPWGTRHLARSPLRTPASPCARSRTRRASHSAGRTRGP